MFENIIKFFKKLVKVEEKTANSKDAAKERLHLVLMQDRANVSADFLELMKQEIIEVIKKYIEVDESSIDVRLTNKTNEDGTTGAPALYANIPIANIKNEMKKDIEKNVEPNKTEKVKDEKPEKKDEEVKKQEEIKEKKKEEDKQEEKEVIKEKDEEKIDKKTDGEITTDEKETIEEKKDEQED